jgi:hypothetical protein
MDGIEAPDRPGLRIIEQETLLHGPHRKLSTEQAEVVDIGIRQARYLLPATVFKTPEAPAERTGIQASPGLFQHFNPYRVRPA